MNTTTPPGSPAHAQLSGELGSGVSADGPIVALHPEDGIFLRADHLNQIQQYARALSTALGVANGAGVVYGYDVTLDPAAAELSVTPGLAVNAEGEPLQSSGPVTLSLSGDQLPGISADGFYVVEVGPLPRDFGSENAYGALCADPCGGGGESVVKPLTMHGVTFRLRADELPGLASVSADRRRNWLASAYFERERAQADPWIVPGTIRNVVPSLAGRDWDAPRGAAFGRSVGLAAVLRVGEAWVLDVWIARRDLGTPPGTQTWTDHLGMRPWSVYVAQILQFQAQLAEAPPTGVAVQQAAVTDERTKITEQFVTAADARPFGSRNPVVAEFLDAYRKAQRAYVLYDQGPTFAALGFDELPPAGYLPYTADSKLTRARIEAALPGVHLRYCRARADHIVTAVAAAQHLDRIPLASPYGQPEVDILIPAVPADLERLRTEEYGWVAFVRRSRAECEGQEPAPTDDIDVYLAPAYSPELIKILRAGTRPTDLTRVFAVGYPQGRPELPPGTPDPGLQPGMRWYVIGVSDTDEGEDLMGKRAELARDAWAPGQAAEAVASTHHERSFLVLAPTDDVN